MTANETAVRPVNEYLRWFLKAMLAGMMISVGGWVFLSCSEKIVGAVLFSIGLFTVLVYGFYLYTGKVCYIFNNPPSYIWLVLITIIGNYVACLIMGYFLPCGTAEMMCNNKLALSYTQILVRAFGCGILMYIAVDQYLNHQFIWATFICVPVFIMAGFEHSIADMFYFASAKMIFQPDTVVFILIVVLGNAIGCSLIPLVRRYLDQPANGQKTT